MKWLGHLFRWWLVVAAGCGFPRPSPVGSADDGGGVDSTSACPANQPLRCDGDKLVRCNSDGTSEVTEACPLGCSSTTQHCNDVAPSNGLASYIDMSSGEPDVDLGMMATINTDNGTVVVDGKSVTVRSALVAQTSAPTILVFIVHSLTSENVTITGNNAFAVVSDGDIAIGGVFAASADLNTPGPGRFNDSTCIGGSSVGVSSTFSGAGGGGFGTAGGSGGSATNTADNSAGGAGGSPTGNPTITPLRGGCDSGRYGPGAGVAGTAGGAIQLVSRTKITISGVVAANGSSFTGGGSGGGILLEAPLVNVTGTMVANGGAGAGGCLLPQVGENGHLDAAPAIGGGTGCGGLGANGGNGGAGTVPAGKGINVSISDSSDVFGGGGGGGVGRIRINTAPGGFHRAGLFSPNPSTGDIAAR